MKKNLHHLLLYVIKVNEQVIFAESGTIFYSITVLFRYVVRQSVHITFTRFVN